MNVELADRLENSVKTEELEMPVFERQLCRTLSAGLVVRHQHYVSSVGRLLGTDELFDGQVGGDRRTLEMPEYYDAHQIPSIHEQSTRN